MKRPHRCGRRLLVAALLVAGSVSAQGTDPGADAPPGAAPAPPTDADRTAEAAHRFERGLAFYRNGEYPLALIEFDRAYELVPDYRVLYNIGQVSIQLAHFARARSALERYLAEGAEEVPAARVAEIQADLEMLGQRTAFLSVEVPLAGSEILIDGEPMGLAPLAAPLLVDAGRHAVSARYQQLSATPVYVTAAGGDSLTVKVDLEPVVAVAVPAAPEPTAPALPRSAAPAPAPPPESRATWDRWWLGWAATGGLAVGAGITFALGDAAARENERLQDEPASPDELQDSKRRATTLLALSPGLAAGAAVVGGFSIYATARHFRHTTSSGARRSATAPSLQVSLAVGARGVGIDGRF
jgi:tetratricopeptide (TPR) repeat protein